MELPPPGYDDPSIVAEKRLKLFLERFEGQLMAIRHVFQEKQPVSVPHQNDFEREWVEFRNSADELGMPYGELVEKVIRSYENFQHAPDIGKLDLVIAEVKNLEQLLAA